MASAKVGSLGVETHLGAGVIALALIDINTVLRVVWIWLESFSAGTDVPSSRQIGAELFASTVVAMGLTGASAGLDASNFVGRISALVNPITSHRGVDAFSIGALELLDRTVAVFGERRAHREVFVGIIVWSAIVVPVAELEDVETESRVSTSEPKRRIASRSSTIGTSLIGQIATVV